MTGTENAHDTELVLASGSRYRAEVLRAAGHEVVTDAPGIDERAADALLDSLGPEGLAVELARRKAAAVAPRHTGATVVAADQVGVLDTPDGVVVLTKQPTRDGAVAQLMAMAGTTHRLVNGVVVQRGPEGPRVEGVDVQVVTMRAFTRDEARSYVDRFAPFDSAGSYRLEDGAAMAPLEPFVVEVRGEHDSGVLGMPLPLLGRLLARL